jgi:PIN domain nuclease of toxin-antitoxin system
MPSVVVDTHAAVWYLLKSPRLSRTALEALEQASQPGSNIFLPSISLVEVIYLVEKGKISQDALHKLLGGITNVRSGWMLASLDLGVAQEVEKLKRSEVPDMPDRIIAATAVHLNLSLVTCDSTLRSIALNTIW